MKIAHFRADITPPIGHPLCAGWYPSATGIVDRLSANGVVLLPEGAAPVVLCALDWAELSNGEYDLWKERLAKAAGTTPDRVTVHCIHAHDAPWPDRDAQKILDENGAPGVIMQLPWCDQVIDAVAQAVEASAPRAQPVTEIRAGKARVDRIASNRRVMGPDGKVKGVRWTRCRDAEIRNAPEGLIDPFLKTISFWNGDKKIVSLHYYAVHPTSYDGTALVTTDFAGIARDRLSRQEGVPHIYFTECGGNITAGKYNDGVADNRERFTGRMFDAMVESEKNERRHQPASVKWKTVPVILPPRDDQPPEQMLALIRDPKSESKDKSRAAIILAYRRRCEAGRPILISALHLGPDIVSVHTPGESFIEYQLFAQELRPDAHVVVPSYGDCGPGYITMERSFAEGGYEPRDSFCSGQSEAIMKDAIRRVVVD
jgi:hypothetical protein